MEKEVLNYDYYFNRIVDTAEPVAFTPLGPDAIDLPFFSDNAAKVACAPMSAAGAALPRTEEESIACAEVDSPCSADMPESGYLTSGFSFTPDSALTSAGASALSDVCDAAARESQQTGGNDGNTNASEATALPDSQEHRAPAADSALQMPPSAEAKAVRKKEDEAQMFLLAGTTNRKCILVSTQGNYQPSVYVFKRGEHTPRIHYFYFDGYTQSPFDVPPSNIQKYLMKKEETNASKDKKKLMNNSEEKKITYCDFCHHKVKNPTKHRMSERHKEKILSYDWKPLLELEEKYSSKIEFL